MINDTERKAFDAAEFLDDLMGKYDFTLPAKAYCKLRAALSTKAQDVGEITPDTKLPCDIRLGESVVKTGCSFRTLLTRINVHNEAIAKGWLSAAPAPSPCTPEEAAELLKNEGIAPFRNFGAHSQSYQISNSQLAAIINADRQKR